MPTMIVTLDCNIFGDFKVGDNAGYNAELLSELVEQNKDGRFNKPIILQTASLIEVSAIQIFYRAKNYNREGVPSISEPDRLAISGKQIDKFSVVIDNMKKYGILDGLGADIYDELHKLRKYRNKIHIQLAVDVAGVGRDEDQLFKDDVTDWAIDLNWSVQNYLEKNYARPEYLRGHVQPLRLPRLA